MTNEYPRPGPQSAHSPVSSPALLQYRIDSPYLVSVSSLPCGKSQFGLRRLRAARRLSFVSFRPAPSPRPRPATPRFESFFAALHRLIARPRKLPSRPIDGTRLSFLIPLGPGLPRRHWQNARLLFVSEPSERASRPASTDSAPVALSVQLYDACRYTVEYVLEACVSLRRYLFGFSRRVAFE